MSQPLKPLRAIVMATALLSLAATSQAAPQAAAEAAEDKPFTGVSDFAFVKTGGNSDITTIAVGQKLTWKHAKWTVGGLFSLIWGEEDGTTNTSRWLARARGDRALNDRLSVFLLGGFERDTFAGIDSRFEEGAGLSYKLWNGERDLLVTDAGISFFQESTTLDTSDSWIGGRLGLLYRHTLAEKAYFQQTIEMLPSFEESSDWRLNSDTSLVAPVWKSIALKVGYLLKYDHQPQPGFEDTDQAFTTAFQYSF